MTRRLLPVLVVAALLACAGMGMGAGALKFDGEVVQLTGAQTGDIVWNSSNFAGFCYNLSDDACVGTETLTIAAYTLEGPDIDRTIDEDCLIYTTAPTWREYELYRNLGLTADGNSRYWIEFWMGEEYVAINRSANKPAKLLVEWGSTDIRTLATGEEWDLGGGFSLVAQQIDLDGTKVWFTLKNDGTELEDEVIDAGSSNLQDRVYTYTGNVSGVPGTPIFSCYVFAVFRGTCSNMVQVKYVFLIDDNVTGIRTGDDYGTMEVKTASSSGITLKNDVPIDLTPNTTTPIMGNLSFKTTNNTGAIEFYPHLIREEPPIHSGGGGFVLDDCRIDSPWNLSENYSIATKDVSLGGDKARIVILKSGTVVGEALLTEELRAPVDSYSYYSYVKNGTEIINVTLKAAFRGCASNVVELAEVYQRSEVDGSILINNASHLFKSADPAGIPWHLADGYVLAMKDVGFNDVEVWLELSKNGVVAREEILNEDSASMFVYTSGTGSVTCMVDCVFRGCEANAVKLVNISQYSDVNGTALIVNESHFYRSADPDGMAWELMDKYVLTMKDLEDQHGWFHGGDKVWLELSKDGIKLKEDILESGDLFEYRNGSESVDCMVEAVFKGSLADVVKLKNVNQYSNTGMQLIENGSKTYATIYPTGDVWELCEDYSFVPKDIDMDGDKAWLSLLKDGVIVKDAIVDSGGDRWFECHNATGALIFRAYLDAVFRGTDSNLIQLTYVSQYSEINGSVLMMFEEDDKKTLSTPHKLPDTWTVDDSGGADFTSIQAAIDAAISGNTIYVYAGTYSENVVVNKQLTLEGEGAEVVTVTNCTSDSPIFNVTADYVNISGFTVTGATGWGAHAGIYLGGVDHCTISSNNVLINCNGIYLYHSDNNTIIDNNASSSIGCGSGILVRSSDSNCIITNNASNNEYPGIYLVASDSNIIAYNTLINNTACNYTYGGLELYFSSSSNTITNNTIIDNVGNGIRIWDSSDSNTLTNNIIESNNDYGVYLSSSSNNLVFHNNLVNNSNNAYDNNPTDNDWHHPVLLEGNYWSDYTGVDDGNGTGKHSIAGDGIGDTDVPHPAGHFDFYPFTNKSGWLVPVNELNIAQARTDKSIYALNETVTISCVVQDETGCNITADRVDAEIIKPDSSIEWVTIAEGLAGQHNGTFTNTSLNGIYNVTIYADKTGYVNDTTEFGFEVLTVAELITINITAQVETVDDPDNILGGAINVGDIITGTYTFDSMTADSNPLPTVGDYRHSSPPCGITVNAGGFVFETDPGNVDFLVEICNDHGGRDNYLLRSYNNLPLPNGVPVTHIAWQLDDPNATALSSDALPTVVPVLTEWQSIFGLTLEGDGDDPLDPGFGYSIRAHVTAAAIVRPDQLYITQARTGKSIHTLNETITISCVVQDETGCNITADSADAKILKPDSSIEWVAMAEGLAGHYNGTFTNTSLNGTYNVTIHADKTGYVNDTAEFCFEVSTSQVRELDTGSGTHPSISGRHTGTIKPLHDVINISTMYTYPCAGTGGHSEYVRIFGNGVDVNGTWNGYQGDYHHLTFQEQFTLLADHTYNYTIETGSYPQIHHTAILTTPDGEITCAEFVDVNGKRYNTWIPAFRLE